LTLLFKRSSHLKVFLAANAILSVAMVLLFLPVASVTGEVAASVNGGLGASQTSAVVASSLSIDIGMLVYLGVSVLGVVGSNIEGRGPAILLLALANKFVTHFTTAVVYFFTALAIGVVGAEFWPVVFGSTIQILATLFSPTIAGEGAREAFQALLLKDELGGVAPAILSAALGFIAAEAATLWGGAFLWTRKGAWRPRFCEVDGKQVDYSWINDDEDAGFDAEQLAQARA
jgi:hypothetical protein